ncbi:glycosyltransferase [Sediminitomix flava]|uniref:Glycosyltransferase involved in cell wall biosynthesis n=1 Tax=Sediminitomix flava TaxID=379075 RepID=A0A315ZDS7_SEDFL|nr:glycosyltransferase [Sediminitomix flava]PWJ43303.1 glycosyltransferase involved in cell wall biosynthesis [Sediminitomix flava]
MQSKIKLGIISPSQNAYSETFIQAHKNLIDADIYYYYSGALPKKLEKNNQPLNSFPNKVIYKTIGRIKGDYLLDEKKAFERSLINNKIEVVLAEYGTTASIILPIVKKLHLPLIVHFHGYDASVYEVIERNNKYKDVFEYAFRVVAVSKVMYDALLGLGCPEEKLILNTYGPNDTFQDLKPTLEDELFVGIGRFVDKKAPYYTILAFQKVLDKFPNAKLVLGGDGMLLNTCHNLVKFLDIEYAVDLLGVIKPEEYRSYLLKARAFVQHSITSNRGDMEGTPLAVLEASAAGVPVISTNHAGIPDVILHEKTGLLVEEHDVEGMANNMIRVLEDRELAAQLGTHGKKRVKNYFSMNKHIGHLNNLVEEACYEPTV